VKAIERFDPPFLRAARLIAEAIILARAALAARGKFWAEAAALSASLERADRAEAEAKLLRERLRRVDPARRPRYTAFERCAILWYRVRYELSIAQTAAAFVVMDRTVQRWIHDARRRVPKLVESLRPANKLPELIQEIIHRLRLENIIWGIRRIAAILARLSLKASRTSVQRVLRRATPRLPRKPAVAQGRPLRATRPNHVWQIDFTKIEVFCLFTIHCCAVIDLFSRKVVGFQLWRHTPTAAGAVRVVRRAIRRFGQPRHLVSDHGKQLTAHRFTRFLRRHRIRHRYGAVDSSLSIAILERFWKTLKTERGAALLPFLPIPAVRRRALPFIRWYNSERPHQSLAGATPNEVFHTRRPTRRHRRTGRLVVRYLHGDRALPIYRLARAA
jgi:putative transposase